MATQIFKHMMPKDIPPFCTYLLSDEGQQYTSWQFDDLVGDPDDPGPMFPMSARRQALYVGALKIDCVGWLFSTPTLIECKPDAGLSAIGQIEGYAKWYSLMYNIYPRKMIVCESMRGQVQTVAELLDIQVRIVQPANIETIERALVYVVPLIQPSPLFANPLELPKL